MAFSLGSGVRLSRNKSWLSYWQAVWPWIDYLTPVCFNLTCKMELIIIPTHNGIIRIKYLHRVLHVISLQSKFANTDANNNKKTHLLHMVVFKINWGKVCLAHSRLSIIINSIHLQHLGTITLINLYRFCWNKLKSAVH